MLNLDTDYYILMTNMTNMTNVTNPLSYLPLSDHILSGKKAATASGNILKTLEDLVADYQDTRPSGDSNSQATGVTPPRKKSIGQLGVSAAAVSSSSSYSSCGLFVSFLYSFFFVIAQHCRFSVS